jgi:hypothetical protein
MGPSVRLICQPSRLRFERAPEVLLGMALIIACFRQPASAPPAAPFGQRQIGPDQENNAQDQQDQNLNETVKTLRGQPGTGWRIASSPGSAG